MFFNLHHRTPLPLVDVACASVVVSPVVDNAAVLAAVDSAGFVAAADGIIENMN